MELDAAQALLRKVAESAEDDGDRDGEAGGEVDTGSSSSSRGCSGGHDHSHAHAHHHGGSGEPAGANCDARGGSRGRFVLDKSAAAGGGAMGREEEEEGARKEMGEVLEVLRRAKTTCRVTEGACLLRGGRVAESTETLRILLFEVNNSWLRLVTGLVGRAHPFRARVVPSLGGEAGRRGHVCESYLFPVGVMQTRDERLLFVSRTRIHR